MTWVATVIILMANGFSTRTIDLYDIPSRQMCLIVAQQEAARQIEPGESVREYKCEPGRGA